MRAWGWSMGLLFAGCTGSLTTVSTPVAQAPRFDEAAMPIDCAVGIAAPLMDAALSDAGLVGEPVGYDERDWAGASYRRWLDDRLLLPWFRDVHWDAARLPCHTGQVSADLDHALDTLHPVATALEAAMRRVGVDPEAEPVHAVDQPLGDLAKLPPAVRDPLAPIWLAMQAVAEARDRLRDEAPGTAADLVEVGHGGVLIDTSSAPDLSDESVQRWVRRPNGPKSLYDPARVLAFAVEDTDWGALADLPDITGTWQTSIGRIVIAGAGSDAPGDIGTVALYVDLGGDDVYEHPAGSNGVRVPVAVHVDLGGNDTYGYVPQADPPHPGMLPSDEGGRYRGDANYGRISLSHTGRQGSGRFGVGMLFDREGDDTYRSLRMSQGYGHFGVGVLHDAAGDDVYQVEAAGQGAAIMGIGLLVDGQGRDEYYTFTDSQGFAGPHAVGIALDGAGDDVWVADPGRVEDGGTPMYATAQIPGNSNASLSQGASTGIRNDGASLFLSGGLGVLRDVSGDDSYTASLFAQGSGYWQGAGYLLDGGGSDSYDALWYVQGGAAHYAIGALMDDGPERDELNQRMAPVNVHLGSGHDFSVGLYVNEGGDDEVRLAGLAGGASNCQGIGIAVDNGGDDVWDARSTRALGLGNQSTECNSAERTVAPSIGLFLDSGGGDDTYLFPDDSRDPGNDRTFGHEQHGASDEFGGAVDGDGETSVHAAGTLP